MKNFIKALDKEGEGFAFLREKFLQKFLLKRQTIWVSTKLYRTVCSDIA